MTGASDIWAVVPVKEFALAKARLAPDLNADTRRDLARVMLEDVLATLHGVPGLSGILVASADPQAHDLARAAGALPLMVAAEGLNAAVAAAGRRLAGEGARAMLVVPGDVPGATVEEFSRLIAAHRLAMDGPGRAVSLVASRDGGTNALLVSPPDALTVAYGEGSFRAHLAAARAAGVTPAVLDLPGIGLDLDTPADVERFLRLPATTRTHRFLHAHSAGIPM